MSDIKKSRIISINDLLAWRQANEDGLVLSPKYQRNIVWNQTMKSYLMDSILRGFPIPPIFIRQKIDPTLKQTFREVIDGQQRIRAILDFIDGKYTISKTHNKECGGIFFDNLPEEIKDEILSYEIQLEVISEKDDSQIYDMFARLNTNNIALNRQELRNAKYWGEFKIFVYDYASIKARDIFLKYNILNEKQITRMADTELLSSLIILLIDGVITETPSIIDKYYEKYNAYFENSEIISEKLNCVTDLINNYYKYVNNATACFNRKTYYYTLFSFLTHQIYGVPQLLNSDVIRCDDYSLNYYNNNKNNLFVKLAEFENEFNQNISQKGRNEKYEKTEKYELMVKFETLHRQRTTTAKERIERIKILNNYIIG